MKCPGSGRTLKPGHVRYGAFAQVVTGCVIPKKTPQASETRDVRTTSELNLPFDSRTSHTAGSLKGERFRITDSSHCPPELPGGGDPEPEHTNSHGSRNFDGAGSSEIAHRRSRFHSAWLRRPSPKLLLAGEDRALSAPPDQLFQPRKRERSEARLA
jgi:hypothetical protein